MKNYVIVGQVNNGVYTFHFIINIFIVAFLRKTQSISSLPSADGLTLYFTCSVTSVTDQKLSDTRRPFSANLKKKQNATFIWMPLMGGAPVQSK